MDSNSQLNEKKELRMYGMVPYNISPIQQAIQFGHAVVEYGLENFESPEYQSWAKDWKTFIILNGGTTNNRREDGAPLGSLNQHLETLRNAGVKVATFREPDLGDQLTAVVFIVDERVFNRQLWPDYDELCRDLAFAGEKTPLFPEWERSFSEDEKEREKVLFLRNFLKKFRLA